MTGTSALGGSKSTVWMLNSVGERTPISCISPTRFVRCVPVICKEGSIFPVSAINERRDMDLYKVLSSLFGFGMEFVFYFVYVHLQ